MLLGEGERPDAFDAPRVAIVGTRSATPHGLADARELGAFLAGAGVTVVSGLAIGIDAAAHEGALDAGGLAVGVVATGLDVVYPRRHRALYARVASRAWSSASTATACSRGASGSRSAIASSRRWPTSSWWSRPPRRAARASPPSTRPSTAAHVFALPGSRRNPAAAGCNALLGDGAEALLDPGDLLIALGPRRLAGRATGRSAGRVPPTDDDEAAVMLALGGDPGADRRPRTQHRGWLRPGWERRSGRLERAGRIQRMRGLWWPR